MVVIENGKCVGGYLKKQIVKPVIPFTPVKTARGNIGLSLITTTSNIVVEPAMGSKQLSQEFLVKVDAAFSNCILMLNGKKPINYDQNTWKQNKKDKENKSAELENLLKEAISLSESKGELVFMESDRDDESWGTIKKSYEIASKTTGFYARFSIDSRIGRNFLLINPGITDSGNLVDVGIEGISNENAKHLFVALCKKLVNFKNPEVWKNPEGWAEAISEGFAQANEKGGISDFAKWIFILSLAVKNCASGKQWENNLRVEHNTSSLNKTGDIKVELGVQFWAALRFLKHEQTTEKIIELITIHKKETLSFNQENLKQLIKGLFSSVTPSYIEWVE